MDAARGNNATPAAEPMGLSSAEAKRSLAEFGPNAVAEEHVHPAIRFARHFWAPVPWMLEATIILQIVIGERLEALMIAALLLLNVGLGLFQESRADTALALLKRRLTLRVRVRRDRMWSEVGAAELVPHDIVQLSLGNVVPADARILRGSVLIDQSMLTGESIPAEMEAGKTAFAGGLVRRGEALAEIVATGTRTYFGRTAELVRVAHVESAEQKVVLGIVGNLTVVNFAIVVGLVAYAHAIGMSVLQIIPLVLTAMLSAVPVGLPAAFTLAAALGARTLALNGVLLTRLSALHEAAMIDVLCADKTGTLTANELAVTAVRSVDPRYNERDVLGFAAAASSSEGQDPIDAAIRAAWAQRKEPAKSAADVLRFLPFDPATKMAEATILAHGSEIRVVKGSPAALATVAPMPATIATEIDALTRAGSRTIAVAAGPSDALAVIGLIGFSDPPRADSAALLTELKSLGVGTVMVSGDAATTAATVAHAIGLEGAVCPPGPIPDGAGPRDFAVYAGIFPEQKFQLVKAFQRQGHAVAMCGDGANDSPALRQAQVGIAVSTATDIAKAAAGIVLTEPGLSGIVASIKEGRSSFQRILTYTLTILVNKCATLVVLAVGLVMTGHAVLTPLLQALSMLTNDFVTMSRTADRAPASPYPNQWHIRNLVIAAIPLALTKLVYCIAVLCVGWYALHFSPGEMQTLTYATLAFGGQGLMLVLRTRGRFWQSRPAAIVMIASFADVTVVSSFATGGILMSPLPAAWVAALLVVTFAYAFAMDSLKLAVFTRLRID
jgi:H+-transporting ATPase